MRRSSLAGARPPLLRAFAEAIRHNPTHQQWLRRHGHALIDALISEGEGFDVAMFEILRLMREGLLGGDNWGSAIWDHDLVPRVIAATGAQGDTRARLELVSSWEGVCHYVSQSRSTQQAQERALEITERIQEVIRLAVEFELVAMDLSAETIQP